MDFDKKARHTDSAHHLILGADFLAVIDNAQNLHFLSRDLSKEHTQYFNGAVSHKYTLADVSSALGSYLCLYLENKKETFLCAYDPLSKSYGAPVKLEFCIGATEASAFSYDEKMLATGGANGHIVIYDTQTAKLLQSYPKQNEYIVCIAFSPNGKFLAYSTFKKRLVITDLHQGLPLKVTSADDVICAACFLNGANFLIYGTRENRLFLYDIVNAGVVKELGSCINWPMAIYVESGDRYALISDKAGYVHIADLTKSDGSLEPLFKEDKIVLDIKARRDEIFFLFEDGELRNFDAKARIENIVALTLDGDFAAMYAKIAKNPMLRYAATARARAHRS